MANYSSKKFSPVTTSLATIHPLQMDGRTTDKVDKHANSSTITYVRSA